MQSYSQLSEFGIGAEQDNKQYQCFLEFLLLPHAKTRHFFLLHLLTEIYSILYEIKMVKDYPIGLFP